jgi:hypothetical protein
MPIVGRLKVVVVKTTKKDNEHDGRERDRRFRRPGRIDRAIENGKDYRSIEYDEERSIEDLLPVEEKKLETSELSKNLKYVLILNFDSPIPKPATV